jgi:glycosyltransferase involved in cell wall biosynthesis
MYDTAAKGSWDGCCLKGGFAFCVSLAAVGRFEEAENTAVLLERLRGFDKCRDKFSLAIALYMPSLALRITKSPRLLAAISAQTDRQKAARLLEGLQIEGEFHLLKSNILASTPKEQLCALNSFLTSYGLSEVSLADDKKCVSVTNIKCAALPNANTENMPLVSILVTTYNTSPYVKSSLESLLSQSYKNLQIIVIDDNSTDDTVKRIKETAAKDNRVKFFINSANIGTFASKNIALKYAEGEFIVCHDSDDFAHPEWIQRQVEPLLENKKLAACVSQWIRVDNEGRYRARSIIPSSRLNATSLLFRKSVLEKTGSWDIVRTGADSEFYARLKLVFGKEAVKYVKLPLIIGAYRENSLTTSPLDGYDENGISLVRLAYWEAWNKWHIDCLKKSKKPIMPSLKRPFPVPQEIAVENIVTI